MPSNENTPPVITFVLGCTACGKGALGRSLAARAGGEIVSVDSMKVYRGMDIGTGKPTAEQRAAIPYHLLDVADPWEEFSVAQFVEHADTAIREIAARGRPIFAVGGTALYIKALSEGLFDGPSADEAIRRRLRGEIKDVGSPAVHARLASIDPEAADRIHPNDRRRIVRALEVFELTGRPISELQRQWDQDTTRYNCAFIGLRRELEDQNHRTNARVRRMIELGLVDEVRSLMDNPRGMSGVATQALGYAEIVEHLHGKCSLADAVEMIKINTRRFAKAQRTWFKRFQGVQWHDLDVDSDPDALTNSILSRQTA